MVNTSDVDEQVPTRTEDDLEALVEKIIKNHAMGAGASGFVPIPLIDMVGIALVQQRMIKSLAQLYGFILSDEQVKIWLSAILGGYGSTYLGFRLFNSWLKLIPGFNLGVAASTGTITYAMGQVFRRHFRDGGTPQTVDTTKMKTEYQQAVKTGANQQASPQADNNEAKPQEAKPQETKPQEAKPQETGPKTAAKPQPQPQVKPQAQETAQQPVQTVMPFNETTDVEPQDLTLVDGIGPKTQQMFAQHNIVSFAQLAATPVSELERILQEAGGRFALSYPHTWPEQAKLAGEENWQALGEFKKRLKGGRLRE